MTLGRWFLLGAVLVGLGLALLMVRFVSLARQSQNPASSRAGGALPTGGLAPCPPGSANCARAEVASGALARVEAALAALPRCEVVEREGEYIRAEARSRLFGFVDDLEVVRDPATGVVHLRSISRVGHSDLGANRRRLAAIKAAIEAAVNAPRVPR